MHSQGATTVDVATKEGGKNGRRDHKHVRSTCSFAHTGIYLLQAKSAPQWTVWAKDDSFQLIMSPQDVASGRFCFESIKINLFGLMWSRSLSDRGNNTDNKMRNKAKHATARRCGMRCCDT